MTVELDHGAARHLGHVRTVQEDAFVGIAPVFAVADGMGGHFGGDVASRFVTEELRRLGGRRLTSAEARDAVLGAFVRAQARLRTHAEGQGGRAAGWYAGTTVVVAVLVEDAGDPRWLVAHVGDSRAYALGPAGLVQLTRDHSLVQEWVDAAEITAEEATVHPERHVVTRALSSSGVSEPDFVEVDLVSAPRLLLCSDGVSGLVDGDELTRVLDAGGRPQRAAEGLVRAALSAGGTDNATALVVDVVGWVGGGTARP